MTAADSAAVETPDVLPDEAALAFAYGHGAATVTPTKVTATQLKGRAIDEEIAEGALPRRWESVPEKPRFLQEKHGLTGAERGIGLEIAKGLAAAGANIIIAGLMEEEFPKAKAAVRAKGVSCTVLKADISKEEDVLRLAEQAWEIFPNGLDILVNNAGVNKLAPAEEMPLEVWQKVVGVNLTGTFLMCRTFGNRMLQQGHGNIVNVASMSGLVVNPLPQQQCGLKSGQSAQRAGIRGKKRPAAFPPVLPPVLFSLLKLFLH